MSDHKDVDPGQVLAMLADQVETGAGAAAGNLAMMDAMLVTLLKVFPPLAGPLLETMEPCESHHAKTLDPAAQDAFHARMQHFRGLINAVREC